MSNLPTLYAVIKHVHITCVSLSISGFVLRWLLALHHSSSIDRKWVRVVPHVVDTALLASAISLAFMAGVAPLHDSWLTAKVAGLLLYIGLGMVALRRTRSRVTRVVAGLAAISVFGYIVSVALSHSPAGYFGRLNG